MSITLTTKTRSVRAKMALVPALTLGLLGGTVAVAGPAAAYDRPSDRGCTVKPLTPRDARGDWVNFPVSVRCGDGRKVVHIQQKRYEKDRGRDTKLHDGRYDEFNYYVHRGDRYEVVDRYDRVSRKLDRRGPEEVYHEIRFAVDNRNGRLVWSDWMRSGTLTGVNSHD